MIIAAINRISSSSVTVAAPSRIVALTCSADIHNKPYATHAAKILFQVEPDVRPKLKPRYPFLVVEDNRRQQIRESNWLQWDYTKDPPGYRKRGTRWERKGTVLLGFYDKVWLEQQSHVCSSQSRLEDVAIQGPSWLSRLRSLAGHIDTSWSKNSKEGRTMKGFDLKPLVDAQKYYFHLFHQKTWIEHQVDIGGVGNELTDKQGAIVLR